MLPGSHEGPRPGAAGRLLCSAPGKSGPLAGGESRSPESLCETAPERTRCGVVILLRCPSSPYPLPHLCDPGPRPLQRDPLLRAASATATWISPGSQGWGALFLLGLGPGWPCADGLAWRSGSPDTSSQSPLWLPIKSCLTFPDGINWILGDVNRGVAGGEECARGTTGVMRVTLCVCTVGKGVGPKQRLPRVPAAAPHPQPAQRHRFSQPVLQVPV